MTQLLSLIIPVFKVENYIEECLASIVAELPVKGVEIILVDDGSPDQSIEIAKKFISLQSEEISHQFKIIHQDNKGLSGARNTGINVAKGKYIGFIDSDDAIAPDYFKILMPILNNHKYDIIQFNYERFEKLLKHNKDNKKPHITVLTKQEAHLSVFSECEWYAWRRIYKKVFFDKNLFPEKINFEDAAVVPFIFLEVKSDVCFITNPLYLYRINPMSITNDISIKNVQNNLKSLKYVLEKYTRGLSQTKYFTTSIASLGTHYINQSIKYESLDKAKIRLKELELKPHLMDLNLVHSKLYILFLKHGNLYITLQYLKVLQLISQILMISKKVKK